MIETVKAAILDYEREAMTNPTSADPTKLEKHIEEAEQDLEETEMGRDAAHNAFGLYLRIGDKQRRLEVLESYLTQELPPDEEAWARWNRVMAISSLRRCDDAVEAHKDFLAWARLNLEPDALLWVMLAGNVCWFEAGRSDEWLETFHQSSAGVPASANNRYLRFLNYRNTAHGLARAERPEEALRIAKGMLQIAREDPDWEYRMYTEMGAYAAIVEAHAVAGETARIRAVAAQAAARLEEYAADLPVPETLKEIEALSPADGLMYRQEFAQRDPVIAYRGAAHNLGAVLYRAKEYKLALPLFERAMAYRFLSQYLAKCYAACLWVTSRDHGKLGEFIEHASPVFGRSKDWWTQVPELEGVRIAP